MLGFGQGDEAEQLKCNTAFAKCQETHRGCRQPLLEGLLKRVSIGLELPIKSTVSILTSSIMLI